MFCSLLTCARMAAGVLGSLWNRWLFLEPLIVCQRPWAETGCWFCCEEAARRVVIVQGIQAAERRIEEAAAFCVSYLRGSRWWDAQVILSPWQQFERRGVDWKLRRLKLTHVGVEREIGLINQTLFAHLSAQSIQRCPKAHRTIKNPKLPDPSRGSKKLQCQGTKQQVEETLTRPHTLKGRSSALCECKSLHLFFCLNGYKLATCLGCYIHLLSELRTDITNLVLHRAEDTVTEEAQIKFINMWGGIFSVQRWEHCFL